MPKEKKQKEPKKKSLNKKEKWTKFKIYWKWWTIFLLFISIIIFILASPGHPAHDIFLKYIYIILTWPFVILVLLLVLLFRYEGAVSQLIKSGFRFKKGDTELDIKGQQDVTELEMKEVDKKKQEELSKIIGERERQIADTQKRAVEEKTILWEWIRFERTIRIMYRSQFNLLNFLKQVGHWPISHCFEVFYKGQYLRKFKGSKDYSFNSYITWLTKVAELIEPKDIENQKHVQLTKLGKFFLTYCEIMKYAEMNFMPF